MTIVQTSLLGLAIALIVALLAALLGPLFIDWSYYRPTFEAQASRLLGLPVRVNGPIDVRLLPTPSLLLNRIEIGADAARQPLRADALGVELALGGLMRGQIRASELRLVGPDAALHLDRDGRLDILNTASGLNLGDVSIERLRIEDARLTLSDAASGGQVKLDKLWFSGEVRSLGNAVFKGEGKAVFDGEGYGYRISTSRTENDETRIRLAVEPSHLPLLVESEGVLSFAGQVPRFEGSLTLARLAAAMLADGRAAIAEPWQVTARLNATPASALFEQLDLQYGPEERALKLGGTAEVKFGAAPQAEAVFSARQVDLDRALADSEQTQREPVAAIQTLTRILGNLWRPNLPLRIGFGIDSLTLGGANLQALRGDLAADAEGWILTDMELRAPGFTQARFGGRLSSVDRGSAFSGSLDIGSRDPKMFLAWLEGRNETPSGNATPMQGRGEVTIAPGRLAIENLVFDIGRKPLQGRLLYLYGARDEKNEGKTRFEAELKAAEADFDALMALAAVLKDRNFERPDEIAVALDIARARFAGLDASQAQIKASLDGSGIRIERLDIGDFGGMRIAGHGALDIAATPPHGDIQIALEGRDLSGAIALAEQFAPGSAQMLRALPAKTGPVSLRGNLAVAGIDGKTGQSEAKFDLDGKLGAGRLALKGGLTGAPEDSAAPRFDRIRFGALQLDAMMESEDAGALLRLAGLEGFVAAKPGAGRATLTAKGPLTGELQVEARLAAPNLDAQAKGGIRLFGERSGGFDLAVVKADIAPLLQQKQTVPLSFSARANLSETKLQFDALSARIHDRPLKGGGSLTFASPPVIDGAFETDSIDLPAMLAVLRGLPADGVLFSEEPFGRSPDLRLKGDLAFRAKRVSLSETLGVNGVEGSLRLSPETIAVALAQGEFARGRLSGEFVSGKTPDGTSVRAQFQLKGADAASFAPGTPPQWSGRFDLNAELEGVGLSPKALAGSLNGSGMLSVNEARITGLDPKAFASAIRAVDQGLPLDANRVRDVVMPALNGGALSVRTLEAPFTITAGQVRLGILLVQAEGAELGVSGFADLREQRLESRILLTGTTDENTAGRPDIAMQIKGPFAAPARSIDVSSLTGWLALRAVEQQSKKLELIERGAADARSPVMETATPATANPAVKSDIQPGAPVSSAPSPRARPAAPRKPQSLPPPINLTPRPF